MKNYKNVETELLLYIYNSKNLPKPPSLLKELIFRGIDISK